MRDIQWKKCSAKTNPSESGHYLTYYPKSSTNKYYITKFNAHKWECPNDTDSVGKPSDWCELPDPPSTNND